MTYAAFLLVFVVVPIAILLVALRGHIAPYRNALLTTLLVAFVYTVPWDNWCVANGIWNFPEDRILFRVAYLPIEEYAFFLLQTTMTGLFTIWLLKRADARHPERTPHEDHRETQ